MPTPKAAPAAACSRPTRSLEYSNPVMPSSTKTASLISNISTRTMSPPVMFTPIRIGKIWRTVIMPARSMPIRMKVAAAALWVIVMKTPPHSTPKAGCRVQTEMFSRSLRPLSSLRFSVSKRRPTKNSPSPASKDAIAGNIRCTLANQRILDPAPAPTSVGRILGGIVRLSQ